MDAPRPVPARPWLPWLAFGLVLGAIAPAAAPTALARHGVAATPSAIAWLVGVPLSLAAAAAARRLPTAARWLVFAAAAAVGAALAARAAPADAVDRLAEVAGEVRTQAWEGYAQGLVLAADGERRFVRAPGLPEARPGDAVVARGALVADERGPALAAVELVVATPRERGPRAWAWRALDRVGGHRELAGTLLLGCGRPPERAEFRAAGLAHVLAVSGMHLIIAAGLTGWLLRVVGVPWGARMLASGALVVGYLWLTGGGSATARAAAMALAALVAGAAGREPHPLGIVALAAAALVVLDPGAAGDIGFQLSLAAVVGIVTLGREGAAALHRVAPLAPWPLDRPVWRALLAGGRAIVDGLAIGLAASLATAPLVAWHFGVCNPWSAAATLAATPSATAALWLGLPTLALAGAWPDGPWEGLYRALELDLDALAATAAACARLPGCNTAVAMPSPWLMCSWPLLFALPTLARAWRARSRG